jgi:hypothetical protein
VRNNNANYVSSRLDFFLISPAILDNICKVKYEDRIGADFDHKEVVIYIGRGGNKGKITVYDSTLEDPVAETMGVYAIYDVINNHLEVRNEDLTRTLVQLDLLVKEREIVNNLIGRLGITDDLRERASNVEINIGVVNRRLPVLTDLLGGRFSCNFRNLYEAIMMGLKNALMILQERKRSEEVMKREWLIESIQQMERVFGEQSDQAETARGNLLRFDDVKLKERASRFRDFLDANNERATKAFCRLSKEGGLCDDLTQIKDKDGNNFINEKEREEHIRGFYETLYKKKMDAILSIEDFLGGEIANIGWVNDRKLNDEERDSLEGPVTLEELKKALTIVTLTVRVDGMVYRSK